MCGIVAVFDFKDEPTELRARVLSAARQLRHRGPDWSGIDVGPGAILAHERLAIVDPLSGSQPLRSDDGRWVVAANGEIYNHMMLREQHADWTFRTGSDCEVLLPLYAEKGAEMLDELRGMFAFAIVDRQTGKWLVARDHVGIIPLYTGTDDAGRRWFASELKALVDVCSSVWEFPPGSVMTDADEEPVRWYQPGWTDYENVKGNDVTPTEVRERLDAAVHSHLMGDVPYGALLSGGLDSSVVCALAVRHARQRVDEGDQSEAWWPRLHTFSIGLEGSPDLAAAQKVADHLGTVHHELHFTVEEGIDALEDVIRHIETYDVTSIRASTPMYLMARRIRSMGIKMVLSGEGADEEFAGYLYFHKAPDGPSLHQETVRKIERLHLYDLLRANKSMSAWGVEARVPFLDRDVLDFVMSMNPEQKLCNQGKIEKHILREAFEGWLPKEVLWRQKEQFSDGVGYSWIDRLKARAEELVSDRDLENAKRRFPINPPATKEGYFYREIFERCFPHSSAAACVPGGETVACSTAEAIAWDAALQNVNDPSGRAVFGVHDEAYEEESAS